MIIGVTGKSGSGKSTLAKAICFELSDTQTYAYCSLDDVGHQVLEMPAYAEKVISTFNLKDKSKVDRKELGDLVFNNRHEMVKLNDIVWEAMQEIVDARLKEAENIVLDYLLLPHTKYWAMCDKTIAVLCDADVRMKRACKRDNITEEKFRLRDSNSIDFSDLKFDFTIDTTGYKNFDDFFYNMASFIHKELKVTL
jgi:dephospho-CoA kinase